MAEVKHIDMLCPKQPSKYKGFVQVVVVKDETTQEKIDQRANDKLQTELTKQHKDGMQYEIKKG